MNNAIKLGAIVINLFVLPFFVFAAPNIADVNGTISHGNSVIISGTEFGAKTTALPNLWDTVDNQSSYNSFSNGRFWTIIIMLAFLIPMIIPGLWPTRIQPIAMFQRNKDLHIQPLAIKE